MKLAIAALELRILEKELSIIKGAKVDQIYDAGQNDFLFQLHSTGIGRQYLRVKLPAALFLEKEKTELKEVSQFCSLLRRKISNKKMLEQRQHGFDRIWVVTLGVQKPEFYLISEFFGTGNMILADENMTVIGALVERSFGIRSTQKHATYQFPKQPIDPFKLSNQEMKEVLKNSKSNQIVKALAIEFSLGGSYAEHVCIKSAVEKAKKPSEISENELDKIMKALNELLKIDPVVVFRDFKPVDITALPLEIYSKDEMRHFDSMSSAQQSFWSLYTPEKKQNPRKQKLETIISAQKRTLEALEKEAVESQKKAESLYLHYQEVKDVIEGVRQTAKKEGWHAAKQKYEGKGIVKKVEEKNASVSVEFDQ